MNQYFKSMLLRTTLLLSALVAGGLMTLIMPTYEQMAVLHEESATPASVREAREKASAGVTGADVDQRHLNFARGLN